MINCIYKDINVETVSMAKDKDVDKMKHAVKLIASGLDAQLRNNLVSLVEQKNVLTQEMDHLESRLQAFFKIQFWKNEPNWRISDPGMRFDIIRIKS